MNSLKQWVLVLFGVAFLNANALGAHLHLCFDGKEAPSSLHVLEVEGAQDAHHGGASDEHNDVDVKLADQALAKVFKFASSMALMPAFWSAPLVAVVESIIPVADADERSASSHRYLLPPLRGPPV